MKFRWFSVKVQREAKPLPAEVVTALAQVADQVMRLQGEVLNQGEIIKVMKPRLETVYRKVYRDIEKSEGGPVGGEFTPPAVARRVVRPGDYLE